MSTPGAVRIERPYDSPDAYLEGDAWTVGRSDMVLIGTEPIEPGTPLTFEIALRTGEVVVRGEARALELVAADGTKDGGLKVRFRQLDAPSKAMLRRALETQKRVARAQQAAALAEIAPPAESPAGPPREAESPSGVRHRALSAIVAPSNRDALLARLRERAPAFEPKRRAAT